MKTSAANGLLASFSAVDDLRSEHETIESQHACRISDCKPYVCSSSRIAEAPHVYILLFCSKQVRITTHRNANYNYCCLSLTKIHSHTTFFLSVLKKEAHRTFFPEEEKFARTFGIKIDVPHVAFSFKLRCTQEKFRSFLVTFPSLYYCERLLLSELTVSARRFCHDDDKHSVLFRRCLKCLQREKVFVVSLDGQSGLFAGYLPIVPFCDSGNSLMRACACKSFWYLFHLLCTVCVCVCLLFNAARLRARTEGAAVKMTKRELVNKQRICTHINLPASCVLRNFRVIRRFFPVVIFNAHTRTQTSE